MSDWSLKLTEERVARYLRCAAKGGWVGVDFDRTLAKYDTWKGDPLIFGEPIPGMVQFVRDCISLGVPVRIFTARVSGPYMVKPAFRDQATIQAALITEAIQRWCEEHIGPALPVTCIKDWEMIELWDDRAVQVLGDTGMSFADAIAALPGIRPFPGAQEMIPRKAVLWVASGNPPDTYRR